LEAVDVAVDVGANVGSWTSGVLGLMSPVLVVAIEPSPGTAAKLRARSPSQVRVVEAAAGAKRGNATLHQFTTSEFSSLHEPTDVLNPTAAGAPLGRVSVPITTLDEELADVQRIDLLKIDVQGHELGVLSGAHKVLQRTSCVIIEMNFVQQYKEAATFCDVHRYLTDVGLRFVRFASPALANGRLIWTDAIYDR
jgi:FkbM family methyltransferase